ncbi:MAG: hypothetical protein KGL46_12495 [Hyphomicrobiales bacterium]|nr:hypothetical protein [Hyphomicrobiales bacterium]
MLRIFASVLFVAFVCGPAGAADLAVRHKPVDVCLDASDHIPDYLRRLLTLYPQGGDAMSQAIYDAILGNRRDVPYAVALANIAAEAQRPSILLGMLRALKKLEIDSPDEFTYARAALVCADPTSKAILAALAGQLYAQGGAPGGWIIAAGGGAVSAVPSAAPATTVSPPSGSTQ